MTRLLGLVALLLLLTSCASAPATSPVGAAVGRTCGDALHSCVLTLDERGRVTTIASVPIGPFTVTLPASPIFAGVVTAQGFASNGTGPGSLTLSSVPFAQLGVPPVGKVTMVSCSDCDPSTAFDATCTSSGKKTGAQAIGSNGIWKCK